VSRRIYRVGAARPLACDAFDETHNVLIEAVGTADRNSIRLAVGSCWTTRASTNLGPCFGCSPSASRARILLPI